MTKTLQYYIDKWALPEEITHNNADITCLINKWYLKYLVPEWIQKLHEDKITFPLLPFYVYVIANPDVDFHTDKEYNFREDTMQISDVKFQSAMEVAELLIFEAQYNPDNISKVKLKASCFDLEEFEKQLTQFHRTEEEMIDIYNEEKPYGFLDYDDYIENIPHSKYISNVLCPDWKQICELKGWPTTWIYDSGI